MFEKIIAAPADPILGLADTFRSDPRTNKINLASVSIKMKQEKPLFSLVSKKRNNICWKTKQQRITCRLAAWLNLAM